MDIDFDRNSKKVLKKLYRSDLSADEFSRIVGWYDWSQPNEIERFLRSEQLITVHTEGVPNGAGGYIPETVTRRYTITRRGRAAVEQLRQNRGETLLRILDVFPLR